MPRYVANQPIRHGWALAFNTGDPVPEDNVLTHGYLDDGLVDELPDDPAPEPASSNTPADPAVKTDDEGVPADPAAAKGKGK